MDLFVVSDLHVSGRDDPFYLSLLSLIRDRARPGDTIVLAGDLFDLFVGNKPVFLDRYTDFIREATEAGRRGVRIHYLEGNHDFLIRRAFAAIPNFEVHGGDCQLELGGKKFYFSHGDRVDRKDYGYRILRGFFRSPVMKAIVTVVPGGWLDWFGGKSSQYSRGQRPALPTGLSLDRMEYLRKTYRSFAAEQMTRGFDFVVMGHCHDLDEMSFNIGDRTGQYVNVGFPRVHGSFLSWSPGDEKIRRERLPKDPGAGGVL